jgi:hypothetical protein
LGSALVLIKSVFYGKDGVVAEFFRQRPNFSVKQDENLCHKLATPMLPDSGVHRYFAQI